MDKEEVLSGLQEHTITIEDQWLVIGQITEQLEDDRLTERRIWFYGKNSKKYALLLDFAFQGKGFESTWHNQHSYQATLKYYPSQAPLRVLVVEHDPQPFSQINWPQITLQNSIDHTSALFAMVPWLARAPIFLPNTKIILYADQWLLQTQTGVFDLNICDSDAWMLLAFSGGKLLDIFAEWNGNELTPLSAQVAADINGVDSSQEYWLQMQRMVVA